MVGQRPRLVGSIKPQLERVDAFQAQPQDLGCSVGSQVGLGHMCGLVVSTSQA
jgi:hypothetical protein